MGKGQNPDQEQKKKQEEKNLIINTEKTEEIKDKIGDGIPLPAQQNAQNSQVKNALKNVPVAVPKKKVAKKEDVGQKIRALHASCFYLCSNAKKFNRNIKSDKFLSNLRMDQVWKREGEAKDKKLLQGKIGDYEARELDAEAPRVIDADNLPTAEEIQRIFQDFAAITVESFKVKTDTEFIDHLEENFAIIKSAREVEKLLLLQSDGVFDLAKEARANLCKSLALCNVMEKWMDAKLAVMKDPLYPYLRGTDLSQAGEVAKVIAGLKKQGRTLNLSDTDESLVVFLNKVKNLQESGFHRSRYFGKKTGAEYAGVFNGNMQKIKETYEREFEKNEKYEEDEETINSWKAGIGNLVADKTAGAKEEAKESKEEKKKKSAPMDPGEPTFLKKIDEFKKIPIDTLKAGSAEEVMKSHAVNAPLIKKAEEIHNLLLRAYSSGELQDKMVPEDVIMLRARINFFYHVRDIEQKLLFGLEKGGIDGRKCTLDQWAKDNGVIFIANNKAFIKQIETKLTNEQKNVKENAKAIWSVIRRSDYGAADQETKNLEFGKNVLFWQSIKGAQSALRDQDALSETVLKAWCEKNSLPYEEPDEVIKTYMRGKSAEEIRKIYARSTGTPEEQYLLYKSIVEETKEALDPSDYCLEQFAPAEGIHVDMAKKTTLANQAGLAGECLRRMQLLQDTNPKMKLSEDDTVSEEWEHEALALSKFANDHLNPRMRALMRMSESLDTSRLSVISAEDVSRFTAMDEKELKRIREYAEDRLNGKEEEARAARDVLTLLDSMQGLVTREFSYFEGYEKVQENVTMETDLERLYETYRENAGLTVMDKETKQVYAEIRQMSSDPVYTKKEELMRLRKDCLYELSKHHGQIEETRYLNLSTAQLRTLTLDALKNQWSTEQLDKQLKSLKKEGNDAEPGSQWNESEQKVMDLAADLIGLGIPDADEAELSAEQRKTRLLGILSNHAEILAWFCQNKDADDVMKAMEGKVKPEEKNLLTGIRAGLTGVMDWINEKAKGRKLTVRSIEDLFKENQGELGNIIAAADQSIEKAISDGTKGVLDQVKAATEDIFVAAQEQKGVQEDQKNEEDQINEEDQENQEEQQKKEAGEDGIPKLRKMLRQSMNKESGEGKFIYLSLQQYFEKSSPAAKRRMMMSMLKSTTPAENPKDLTEEQKKTEQRRTAGRYLGGLLKGAGPMFQKMLQAVPDDMMQDELRSALKDVKSKLSPIPRDYVEEQLEKMKTASGGKVTELTMIRSLGAASVGQAFLCRMSGPGVEPGGTKEVVVKLLRPNIKKRLDEDTAILREIAGQAGESILKDFEVRLLSVNDELDLSKEAKNAVEAEKTYNYEKADPDHEVTTVKVSNEIAASKDYMVLDKAEGITLDNYLDQMNQTLDREWDDYVKPFVKDEKHKYFENRYELTKEKWPLYQEKRMQLKKMLESVIKRQKHLVKVSDLWVRQALFGTSFYHGDLHAGNIMISEDKATLIDYGNASKFTVEEQGYILIMTSALGKVAGKNPESEDYEQTVNTFSRDFLWAFTQLLPKGDGEIAFKRQVGGNEETHPRLRAKGAEFLEKIKEIMKEKNPYATPDEPDPMIGEKVAMILKEAQKLGLQLPPPIQAFSQSQLRIQNSLTEMNNLAKRIRKRLSHLDNMSSGTTALGYFDIKLLVKDKAPSREDTRMEPIYRETRTYLSKGYSREEFEKDAKKYDDEKDLEEFDKKYCPELGPIRNRFLTRKDSGDPNDVDSLSDTSITKEKLARVCAHVRRQLEEKKKQYGDDHEAYVKAAQTDLQNLTFVIQYFINFGLDKFVGGPFRVRRMASDVMKGDQDALAEYLRLGEEVFPMIFRYCENINKLRQVQNAGFFESFKLPSQDSVIADIYRDYEKINELKSQSHEVMVRVEENLWCASQMDNASLCGEQYGSAREDHKALNTKEPLKSLYAAAGQALQEIKEKCDPMAAKVEKGCRWSNLDNPKYFDKLSPEDQQVYLAYKKKVLDTWNYYNWQYKIMSSEIGFAEELKEILEEPQGQELKAAFEDFRTDLKRYVEIRFKKQPGTEEDLKSLEAVLKTKEAAFMKIYRAISDREMKSFVHTYFEGEDKEKKPIRLDQKLKDTMNVMSDVVSDNKIAALNRITKTENGHGYIARIM